MNCKGFWGSHRLVCWGGRDGDLDSFRHIFQGYYDAARKLGYGVDWLPDHPSSRDQLNSESVVLTVDRYSSNIGAAVPGASYVIHNYDASHELVQSADPSQLLRLQVYTNDSVGEVWEPCRVYEPEGRILFQPWGTDLLAEEFMEPVWNGQSDEVVFVGAIWSDYYQGQDLGNTAVMGEVRAIVEKRGLKFRHLTQIPQQAKQNIMRNARLAPAFAGGWQVEHNYLPCRAFKAPSYGQLLLCNVPKIADLYGMELRSVADTVGAALSINRGTWMKLVKEQQRVAARYTYRENLQTIVRALEEAGCV